MRQLLTLRLFTGLLLVAGGSTAAYAQRGVGIGTQSPQALLHLDGGSTQPHLLLRNPAGGPGTSVNVDFQTYDPSPNASGARLQALDNNYSADLLFFTKKPGASANALTERLRLTNDGRLGVGTSAPAASALLDLTSTTQGLLLPRLTQAQRDALGTTVGGVALAAPVPGLVIYQTDNTPGLYAYDGTAWVRLGADNLGNHTATLPLNLQANALTGTGASIGSAVGVGVRADGGLNLGQNTTQNVVAIGYQAGAVSTGADNLFVGYQAGLKNADGYGNTFVGKQSGTNTSSGYYNTFLGSGSGLSNKTGIANTFLGSGAGVNSEGSTNTFVGTGSGLTTSSGSSNTFVGTNSGFYTNGSSNTVVGAESGAGVSGPALTNATALGANVTLTTSNTLVLGNGANVGIGTSEPGQKLDVRGNANLVGTLQFSNTTLDKIYLTNQGAAGSKLAHLFDWGVAAYAGPGSGALITGFHSWYTTTGAAYAEQLRLNSTGLGVGTTAPATKLDVNGNLRLAMRLSPVNQPNYTLTAADLAYSTFKIQNGSFVTNLTLPAAGTGQVEGQQLTIFNVNSGGASILGTNTDNPGSPVALPGIGTAGAHSVQYVWVVNDANTGYWVRVQ